MSPAAFPSARVTRVETLEGVEALADEWAALEAATPEATGFQSFVWCRSWLALADARTRPGVVCVREGERLVMLLPLQIERRFGVSIARWIGEPLTQYGDALALPEERRAYWRELAEAELARWRSVDLFALTRLRAGGVMADGVVAGEAHLAPYVALRAARPRRHKSMERRLRRLEARGPVTLDEADTPSERESHVRHALKLKRGWLGARGAYSAGLSHPAADDFLASLARQQFLRVNVLKVGDEIGAMDLGFIGGGAYRSFLGCYDDSFAEGSPGQALTGRVIARCAGEGLSAYDMLLPADAYKRVWATGLTPIEARFIARSFKGRVAAFALARLRPLAKRAVHGLGRIGARLRGAVSFASEVETGLGPESAPK